MKQNWSLRQQYDFIKRLGELLGKGYSFIAACEFIQMQLNQTQQKQVTYSLDLLIRGGDVIDMFDYLDFHHDVKTYLHLSKEYGTLSECLLSASQLLHRRIQFIERVKQLIKYPIFLLGFLIVITLLCHFVIFPQFQHLFQNIGATNQTSPVVILVRAFPFFILSVCICCIGVYFFYKYSFQKREPYEQINMIARIPFLNKLMQSYYTYYFANQLGGLLQSGSSLYEALKVIGNVQGRGLFQDEMMSVSSQLLEGKELVEVLQTRKWVRQDLCKVLIHGNANSNLEMELKDYSVHILDELERKVHQVVGYLAPLTFVFIGTMVVIVYLSLLLPLFDTMKNL
ncbi:MAG: competence type IV pilus assembly protein ComGB [Bacillaceae bacterium]